LITGFDYPSCEDMGLITMDFLGLPEPGHHRSRHKDHQGQPAASRSTPRRSRWTTPATYDLLARGDTLGVFQLDGGPMRALLRLMKPTEFADISAVSALYRPGPMGMNSHTNYALRKNAMQEITPDPPGAGGPAQRGPRPHLRP